MADFLLKLGAVFEKISGHLRILEDFLHKRFLGFELFYFFEAALIVCFIVLVHFLSGVRIRRTQKKFALLEKKFESFKEEINLQIASIKLTKIIPTTELGNKESLLDEMLGTAKKAPQHASDEVTGVREAKREEFRGNGEAKTKTLENVHEVGALFEGLEDDSNPLQLKNPLKRVQGANGIAKTKENPKISESIKETPTKSVVIPGEGKWDAKTVLKSEDDLENDRTRIDNIDQNIDLGSDEISIPLGSDGGEPVRTIDTGGNVEERRDSKRIGENVNMELVFDGFTDFIRECSVNISKGGIFIKSASVHPVGTSIGLEIKLKDGYRLIKCEGEVIRIEQGEKGPKGMGIKFIKLDEESRLLIDKILEPQAG
jgi:uncharacterized protein (TIGR02266 family)